MALRKNALRTSARDFGTDKRSYNNFAVTTLSIVCPQVEFAAEGVKMELIEAAKSGAAGASAWGKMDFHCREPRASDPITFTTRDSHLVSTLSLIPVVFEQIEKRSVH